MPSTSASHSIPTIQCCHLQFSLLQVATPSIERGISRRPGRSLVLRHRPPPGHTRQRAPAWLLAHGRTGGTFGSSCAPGRAPAAVRTAWCYGDPGVAASLVLAAESTGDRELRAEAIALASRAAERPFEHTGVVDAALCHGSAGLMHVYNRIHQQTGAPALRDAARQWLRRTLDMAVDGDGPAGYRSYRGAGLGWVATTGFLEGIAGIALALLAAISTVEPSWDRLLLLSLAGPARRRAC